MFHPSTHCKNYIIVEILVAENIGIFSKLGFLSGHYQETIVKNKIVKNITYIKALYDWMETDEQRIHRSKRHASITF